MYYQNIGNHVDRTQFSTAFVRPYRFRFEYHVERRQQQDFTHWLPNSYIVWKDGPNVQSWWSFADPRVKTYQSLSPALGAATGISSTSSSNIPSLLLPEEVGHSQLIGMPAERRIADAVLDGAGMFRIQGTTRAASSTTLWIDKATFLIRRIDRATQFPTFHTVQTITYRPSINVEIPDSALAFNYPRY